MSYREATRYLDSLVNYERSSRYPYKQALNLKRFREFLGTIANPQAGLRCIHIAGSKGKGSTAAFLTYILREAGFKVGLYTSPHLVDFRERIRVLTPKEILSRMNRSGGLNLRYDSGPAFEGMITKNELARLVKQLRPAMEKYNRVSKFGPLTFFEAFTTLAFLYFQEKKVDFAVLETGLGGRLDATNVIHPLASVITPISYEHMDKLGRTLSKIAGEKAGIIKKNTTVISAPQAKEAMRVIRRKCKKERARLLVAGKSVKNFKIKLIGEHQLMNAGVSVAAINSLRAYGIKVGAESIRRGLYNTLWPGRCEVVAKRPWVVLDGAQNSASAAVLKKAIQENFHFSKLILVIGVSNDKDIKGIAGQLKGLADKVILTKAASSRATAPAYLAGYFRQRETYITDNVKEAAILAKGLAKKEDLVLVTGSLFVVGEFRNVQSRHK